MPVSVRALRAVYSVRAAQRRGCRVPRRFSPLFSCSTVWRWRGSARATTLRPRKACSANPSSKWRLRIQRQHCLTHRRRCVRQCWRWIRRRHLLDGFAEQAFRGLNVVARAEPRQRQTVEHENSGENRRGTRQPRRCAARTEYTARSARTETGTRIGSAPTLQQHERDDRDRDEHLQDGQSGQQHVMFTFRLQRPQRRSLQTRLLSVRLHLSGHRRHPASRKSRSRCPP